MASKPFKVPSLSRTCGHEDDDRLLGPVRALKFYLKKANATFAKLENFTQIALDWADGTIVLEELAGDTGKDIQALFESELVKSLVMQMSGVNNQDLTNLIYTFQDADTGLMKSISKVASLVSDYVSCIEINRYVGYATESDMQTAAIQFNNRNELLAGLVFEVSGKLKRLKRHTHPISTHIQYKIRMDVDNSPNTNRIKDRMWRPQPEDHFFNELRYFRGFIQLQDMIDSAIISLYAEHEQVDFKMPRVATNQFPFPCHTLDTFVNTIAGYLLPVLMTISFIASIAVAVYNLVYDRERGQEETLNIMGLKCGLNFWAWLLTTYLIMAAVCGIDIIILKYANIFTESNAFIVWLYFIDFAFSILMLCYFVSAFFTRTSLAILTCFIVYFISYLPFVVLYTLEVDMTFWQKTLACLSSTTAFSYAAQYIARFEEQMIGLQWSNVVKDPYNTEDDFNFRWCNIMMVIDSGIYFILGWYVRNVMPGKFGVSEPWYFFCLPSRWCCSKSSGRESAYSPSNQGKNVFSEPAQKSTPVVLSARGLTKTYSDGTRAVSDLNLDIHSGNITTLLGHNGAAKTTTMNMLTGMLEPSSGSVRLLNRPLSDMRGSIGLCSQGNALYEYMTVKEHMEFYSAIKDSYNAISKEEEIRQLLKDVDLYHCRHTLVRNLSGGMQRRLSIALAFVGGSKAVILDEPTSGVDPSGRRAIWNLIVRRKDAKDSGGAAILLSTHHLDEADVVSDQIAILHEGRLLCQGSPMFLKHHLASGHRLTITSTKQDPDPVPILSLITRWIPGSKLQQMTGSDMTFVVPASTAAATNFDQFFQEMESRKYELDIESFGISDPQLQEVFLKVCAAADAGHIIQPETLRQMDSQSEEDKSSTDGEWKHDFEANGSSSREHLNKMTVHSSSRLSLIFALLTKRFLHYIRNWKLLVAVLILPLLLFLLACGLYLVKPTETESPSIILSPAMYGPGAYSFNKQRSLPQTGLDGLDIVHTFMQKPGYSTSCINASFAEKLGSPYECVDPDTSYHNTSYQHMTCKCDDNKYSCAATNNNASIPEFRSATGDILVDLVNHKNISQYLLETFEQFITKRFGGFEFSDGTDDNNMPVLDAKIWYNNKGYHAMPSFYNAYSNGLLRALMARAGKQSEQYGISTYNHPFVFGKQKLSKQSMLFAAADIGIALIILIAFTFVPIGCLLYLVTEFLSREKHMQFIAGIGSFVYWISSFIWDMMIMGISIGIAAIIILIFKPASFWDRENLGAVCVLLALFGSSTITLCYCFSKRFSSSGAAFFTLFCFLNFIGIITIIVIFALNWWRAFSEEAAEGYRICHYVFLIFPPYALASGFMDLIENQVRTTIYERFDYDAYNRPFTLEMIGWNLIAMGIETFVFFVLTIVMDLKCCCGSNSRQRYLGMNGPADEDVDVSAEKVRIDRGDCRQDVVVVRNLHKVYKSGKTELQAVNGLSFGVPANQCFGLLGINGAGKTTTFKILTGCINASDGFTSVLGSRILPGSSSVGRMVGYCPQEDALDSYLSVESMLHFHCKLKGIPASKRTEEVTSVMERLQLTPIKGKLVRACSGGMKRKLSLAIALLGSPPVILLDEPTTGMDPKAKKLVWDCLFRAKHQGQAIILTSHSLEECDILCDRIGIMVNGEFKCLGSSQHLKQKFGNGYTVTLYVSGLSTIGTRIYELIHNHFPSASIRSHHVNVIQLDIPRESVSVAEMFSVLEREKNNYNIEYYTVSQTTLETIFLNIAGEQTDGANLDVSDTNSSSGATGSDISSKMAPMGVSNPFYEHVKKPITLADTGMGPNGSNAHSPFVLPVKDKLNFKDEDGEIFITRL
ncbi:hypothetical protein DPMN_036657 [Dreissena polymorpha]|uniref:ABC transporter domain-containing protein n=1 Tax=Dreissena polymorpha TaxID=45954 RepID=A0A9D4RP14_DREPO|nr:hypothetical protein DPMN_036657 [Dreissena polymorpha]